MSVQIPEYTQKELVQQVLIYFKLFSDHQVALYYCYYAQERELSSNTTQSDLIDSYQINMDTVNIFLGRLKQEHTISVTLIKEIPR